MDFIKSIYDVYDILDAALPKNRDDLKEQLMIGARQALDNGLDCHGFSGRVYGIHRDRLLDFLRTPEASNLQSIEPGDIHHLFVSPVNEPFHTGIYLGDPENTTISKHGKKPEIMVGTPEEVLKYYSEFAFHIDALSKIDQKSVRLPRRLWFQDYSIYKHYLAPSHCILI